MRRLALLGLVLALAACGGDDGGGTAAGGGVAEIVPASAPLLVTFETDRDSKQWQQADRLLDRFPGRERLLRELREELADEGLNLEQDVFPALGDEVHVVVLDFEGKNVVGIAQPEDEAAFRELLGKSDEELVSRKVEGWTLVARSNALLDRFGEGEKLAGADWFEDAQERVQGDALVTLYANGTAIEEAARASLPPSCPPPKQTGHLTFAVATLSAEETGVRFSAVGVGEGGEDATQGESLLSEVPSGVFAYIGFPGFDFGRLGVSDQIRCALEGEGLGEAQQELGVPVEDIVNLFASGFAVWVRGGALIPDVTLMLGKGADRGTVDALFSRVADELGVAPTSREVNGVEVKELLLGPVRLLYGEREGRVVVTTSRTAFEALGEGRTLEEDAAFERARDAAGAGDDDVFIYLDLAQLVDLVERIAGLAAGEIPQDVVGNLAPLRSFLVWGDLKDPNESELSAFLEIE